MSSDPTDFNDFLSKQESLIHAELSKINEQLFITKSPEVKAILWRTPLSYNRYICDYLCRIAGILFHQKNKHLSDEYILKTIVKEIEEDVHSFNLVKFAAGVQLNKEYTKLNRDDIRKTVFSPLVETSKYWYSENVSKPTHSSSKSPKDTNPDEYLIFKDVCEKFKDVLSNLSKEFYENECISGLLDKFNRISEKVDQLKAYSWKDTLNLCEICESIPLNRNELRYVAFAPDRFDSEDDMERFLRINWHFVFDPYQNNEGNKLLSYVKKTKGESSIQLITDKATLNLSSNKINWFFPFGEREKINIKKFTKLLREKINNKNDNFYILIDFNETLRKGNSAKMFESFVSGVFDTIYTDGDNPSFNRNCHLITLKNKKGDDNKLNEFICEATEDDDNKLDQERIKYLEFGAKEFLEAAEVTGLLNSTINSSENTCPFLNKEIIRDCNSAGISFLLPDNNQLNSTRDFFCGHKIQYSELEKGRDVIRKRKEYERFKNKVSDAEIGKTFSIYHEPGAGGTTLSRRLAFDLSDGGMSKERYVVFLNDFENPINTKDKLFALSESNEIKNKPIIIISEQDTIDDHRYNQLKQLLKNSSKYFIHVRVIHSTVLSAAQLDSIFLTSTLNEEEKGYFLEKYKQIFIAKTLNSSNLNRIEEILNRIEEICSYIKKRKDVEVVDFPYSFTESFIHHEGLTKETIVPERGKYVETELNKLSKISREFVKFVAFSYYFTNQGVTASVLKNIWNDNGKYLTLKSSFKSEDHNHIYKLLKEEPGESEHDEKIWSPRYSAFAREILIHLCGKEEKWPLSELSYQFLMKLPSGTPEQPVKTLLNSMFIQQSQKSFNPDTYVASVEKDKRKELSDRFSKLIGLAYNSSGISTAKRIFDSLIKKYENEWHYVAHKGRLLFEAASFENQVHNASLYKEAEECIREAEEILEANDYPYDEILAHIHGMLYLRRLQSFENNLAGLSNDLILDYVNNGRYFFMKSIDLNIASPYGYMSLGNLYKYAILLGASIHSKESKMIKECNASVKSFCDNDKDNPYTPYVEYLDRAVEALISFNFSENTAEYKGTEGLRRNLSAIYGHTAKDIEKYKLKFNESVCKPVPTRIYYGRALINCRKNYSWDQYYKDSDNQTMPKRTDERLYNNMRQKDIDALKYDLKNLIALGDLDAHRDLFMLNRYTKMYEFEASIEALNNWRKDAEDAEESGGITAKRSIMWSNYYLGVAYSAILINSETPDTEKTKAMKECFDKTRKYGNLVSEELFRRKDVLGNDHKYTWKSIIPFYDAYKDPKGQSPKDSCSKKNAVIIDVDPPEARVGQLEKISFRGKLFGPDYIGKTIKDATINFTLAGPGLYNFDLKPWSLETADVSSEQESLSKTISTEDYTGISDSENRTTPKILGKIDLNQFPKKSITMKNKEDRSITEEWVEAKPETTYTGVLIAGEKNKVFPNENLTNAKNPGQKLRFICIGKNVSNKLKEAMDDKDKVTFQIKYDKNHIYAINLKRVD